MAHILCGEVDVAAEDGTVSPTRRRVADMVPPLMWWKFAEGDLRRY